MKFEIGHVLFVDIVGFSKLLINEQSELVRELNDIVRSTEQVRAAEAEGKLTQLPTGDGMALVFRNSVEAAAQCAQEIARARKSHPVLRLRMGIHSGPVNVVVDVNERANVAGAGINVAQRVMDCGDAGHILFSKRAADDLIQYREWQPHLHELGQCEVKHGARIDIVNFYTDEIGNPEPPQKFEGRKERGVFVSPWPKTILATGALLVLLALGLFFFFHRSSPTESQAAPKGARAAANDKSIAVLPFVDLSQAHDQEYFCDGISEELLDALAKIEGLRVVARTSSFSFKGKNADVGEIAQKLNVGNVLEGSLRREGNRIRITAQLIGAGNGSHLWSETYERELQGVFAVQDEITRAIVDALKIKLAIAPAAQPQRDTEAHDLYLQGLYFSNKSTEEGLRKSLDFFQRSLEKDPNSARAWAGIAKVWTWLADAYVKPMDAYPAMKAAALKAVALDDREPEAHIYLSEARRVLDWDMVGADAELRRALQLDPNSATAHLFLALNFALEGRPTESVAHIRASEKADPLSPIISNFAGVGYLSLGHVDEAIAEGKRTLQLDPNYIYESPILAGAYREKGMYDEAIALFKKAQEMTGAPQPGLAITYARIGRQSEARQILEDLKQIAATKYIAKEEIAAVYVALGEKDEAFKWLDGACQDHGGAIHAIAISPVFRALHSDPRFADILRRIGLEPEKVLDRQSHL
ncbi:MAG: adenylate/guanylate cyclase domain-containing protein [Spartobacteria bacterium]